MSDFHILDVQARRDDLNRRVVRVAEVLVNTWRHGRDSEASALCEAVLENLVDRLQRCQAMLLRAKNGSLDLQTVKELP